MTETDNFRYEGSPKHANDSKHQHQIVPAMKGSAATKAYPELTQSSIDNTQFGVPRTLVPANVVRSN